MEPRQLLNPNDELNLYLAATGIKPASKISLSPKQNVLSGRVIEWSMIINGERWMFYKLDIAVVDDMKHMLKDMGLPYTITPYSQFVPLRDNYTGRILGKEAYKEYNFNVGSNMECLDRLVFATSKFDIGLALGYPLQAARAFTEVIKGERRDNIFFSNALGRAKEAGMELPSWLAYISFIPEEFDLVNGIVPCETQELGERYQAFVRQRNPELAGRVEKHFLESHSNLVIFEADKNYTAIRVK